MMEPFRYTSNITVIGDPKTTQPPIGTSERTYETTKQLKLATTTTNGIKEMDVTTAIPQSPISQTTESNETTSSSSDEAPTRMLVGINVLLMLRK